MRLYDDLPDDGRVKVLPNETFGFQRITVERPLRRRWEVNDEVLALLREPSYAQLATIMPDGSPQPPNSRENMRATTHA